MAELAAQLRKPSGDLARKVAQKMNESNRFLYQFLLGFHAFSKKQHVLEIGFGNGHFFPMLFSKAPGMQLTGCDFSPEMVAAATAFNEALIDEGHLVLHLTDGDHLPLDDEEVDMAFCINVIYFWDDAQRALTEIHRVLAPGGVLLLGMRPAASMKALPFTQHGFRLWELDELKQELEAAGFTFKESHKTPEPPVEIAGHTISLESWVVKAVKE